MFSRTLLPALIPLVLLASACQHSAAAASPPEPNAQTPAPFSTPPVLAGTPDVATLVAMVRPSVVNITTVQQVHVPRGQIGLSRWLRRHVSVLQSGPRAPRPVAIPGFGGGRGRRRDEAAGPRVRLSSSTPGHVVTNAHVIAKRDVVKVKLADDREFRAKVVGKDERLDVAVLQLQGAPGDLPVAALGASEVTRVGEYVVAIGNPFGLGNTVTMGIVSAKGRSIGAGPYDDFIQTDASINPGNSGGPLFNLRGQVVGINTAINPQRQGHRLCHPDRRRERRPSAAHRERPRGARAPGRGHPAAWMRTLRRPSAWIAPARRLGRSGRAASPADAAGIKAGDVILAVDGQDVPRSEELPRMIARHAPGSHVKLAVLHEHQKRDVDIALMALKEEGETAAQGAAARARALPSDRRSASASMSKMVTSSSSVCCPTALPTGSFVRATSSTRSTASPFTIRASSPRRCMRPPTDRPILMRVRRGEQSRYVAIERAEHK
jgi:serine protease Do